MSTAYQIHPAADIFPKMTPDEFAALREDIRAHGQLEDIALFEDKVLDGRHRLRACQELGLEPQWYELTECDDPIEYVLSKNLHRRHLSQSQRAQCAADVAKLRRGNNQHTSKDGCSIEDAAKAFGVSRPSVERAKHVADKGDQSVVEAVKAGKLKVSAAAKLVDAVPHMGEQRRIVKEGPQAVRERIRPVDDEPCSACQVGIRADGDRCQRCIDAGRTGDDELGPAQQARPRKPASRKASSSESAAILAEIDNLASHVGKQQYFWSRIVIQKSVNRLNQLLHAHFDDSAVDDFRDMPTASTGDTQ